MKKLIISESYLEFLIFPILVPLLLILGYIPENKNLFVLISVLVVVGFIVFLRLIPANNKWNLKDVGIGRGSINLESILMYFLLALLLFFGFLSFYGDKEENPLVAKAVAFSFFYASAQQFLYTGYLLKLVDVLFKKKWISNIVYVILFTGMHMFFKLNLLDYFLIAVAGSCFLFFYRKYPSLPLVILLHFQSNLMAINLGMFHPHLYF